MLQNVNQLVMRRATSVDELGATGIMNNSQRRE